MLCDELVQVTSHSHLMIPPHIHNHIGSASSPAASLVLCSANLWGARCMLGEPSSAFASPRGYPSAAKSQSPRC